MIVYVIYVCFFVAPISLRFHVHRVQKDRTPPLIHPISPPHPFPGPVIEPLSCVRLPDVLEAYDGTGTYTKEQRHLLVNHLQDPEQRKHPWPAKLDVAFGIEDPEEIQKNKDKAAKEAAAAEAAVGKGDAAKTEPGAGREAGAGAASSSGDGAEAASTPKGATAAAAGGDSRGRGGGGRAGAGRSSGKGRRGGAAAVNGVTVLLGSPMLDATLEDTQGLREVIETLKQETGLSDGTKGLQMEVCTHVMWHEYRKYVPGM